MASYHELDDVNKTDKSELVGAVKKLPDIECTLRPNSFFSVLTASLDRSDAELVMRGLFGLGPLEYPVFPDASRVNNGYRAATKQTIERFSSLGWSKVTIVWTDIPGRKDISDDSDVSISMQKFNDHVLAAKQMPVDLSIGVVDFSLERLTHIEALVLEVSYLDHPQVFCERGVIVQTSEHKIKRVMNFRAKHMTEGRKDDSKSALDEEARHAKHFREAAIEYYKKKQTDMRNCVLNVYEGMSVSRPEAPKSSWFQNLFRRGSASEAGNRPVLDAEGVPILIASKEETLMLTKERWVPALWLTVFLRQKDERLGTFFKVSTAWKQLDEEQTKQAVKRVNDALKRLKK